MTPTCPYCQQQAELVGGAAIYPHRQDLADKRLWNCAPCGAYVGCHDGTETPLGRLANAELREQLEVARAIIEPIATCEPTDVDPIHKRVRYVDVQMNRTEIAAMQAWLDAMTKETTNG